MANCSEDGHKALVNNYESPNTEINNDSEDPTIQRALENIFLVCDKNNTGYALVSDLIYCMTPHLQSHLSKLMLLKKALDPNETNPLVDHGTFYNVMSEWTSQILAESPELDCKRHGTVREPKKYVDETNLVLESSPKSPLAKLICEAVRENSESSLDDFSKVIADDFFVNNESDMMILQEHIKQLEHQNRKLADELENTRCHLTASEEQNETFQADLERISRRLISEQQINAQLEKDRQTTTELLEASSAAQKQIGKLEKDLATSEKQLSQLKETIEKLAEENQRLENKIDKATQRETAIKQQITELQNEVGTKEQEISLLEETNTQLKINLETQKQEIVECSDINVSLKAEKEKLEQCLRNSFKNQSLQSVVKPSQSFTEYPSSTSSGTHIHTVNISLLKNHPRQYVSPFQKILQNKNLFGSPTLQHMLANPVSPCLDNSTISSSFCNKMSVDCDDSPLFTPKENFASTPQDAHLPHKTFFDGTLPIEASDLPILSPLYNTKETVSFRQHHLPSDNSFEDEECNNHINSMNNLNNSFSKEIKQSSPQSYKKSTASDSLPTIYVVERTALVQKYNSVANNSDVMTNDNVLDNSSEDDLFWKMQMVNYSPHESLEAEISQAEENERKVKQISCTYIIEEQQKSIHQLQTENSEIKKTIENLIKENSRLNLQILSPEEKQKRKPFDTELRESCGKIDYEADYKILKFKLEELERDNNHKYIRIIDLMEEKEALENKLSKINNVDTNELTRLQMKFSELQSQKEDLLSALEKFKWEKQNSDAISKHLQSVKSECEALQNQLQHFRKVGENLSEEFEKISNENIELKTNINNLVETVSRLNSEKGDLSNTIQKLQTESKQTDRIVLKDKCKEMEENLSAQKEEIKTFKNTTSQQKKMIEALNKKIAQLTITDTNFAENLTEKECQTEILKQVVNHQNETLKTLEDQKECILNQFYEQKSVSDKLTGENRDLMGKLECAMAKLSIEQDRREKVMDSNIELTEKLELTASQLYEEKCENQKIMSKNIKITEEFRNAIQELQKENGELKEKLTVLKVKQDQFREGLNIECEKKLSKKLECIITDLNEQQGDNEELIKKIQSAIIELEGHQCHNEKLLNINTELSEKLKVKEKEIEELITQLQKLEENNENVKVEFEIVNCDYKNIKDTNNNIKKENELLSCQKNVLVNKLESLANDFNEIKGLKETIDQELLQVKNETDELRKENNILKKTLSESNTNLHTKQVEISNLLNEISQLKDEQRNKVSKDLNTIQTKLSNLENQNKSLLTENGKLKEHFETIRCNYNKLANEKEEWLLEKANWQHILDECSKKLNIAKDKEHLLLEELNKNVSHDKSDCSSCAVLKTEIEQLNVHLNEFKCKVVALELDDKGVLRSPNRSYDKLQVKIEKLKNKLFIVEEQLRMEKHKSSTLEIENSGLKMELQENVKQFKEERLNLCATISSFEGRLNKREDNYFKMQENKIESEYEKECLIKNNEELRQKLESASLIKEKRWKALNYENHQLKAEIEELNKIKTSVEKKLERAQANLKTRVDSDKKENENLKKEIENLNIEKNNFEGDLKKIELDLKHKIIDEQNIKVDLQQISKENNTLKEQIKEVNQQKVSLEKKLEKSENDLRKSETKMMSIRKELIDMQSLHENTILKNIECRNIDDLMKEKDFLQKQLADCENQLTETKIQLCDSSNHITLLLEYVKDINERLGEKRHRLCRSTLTAISSWHDTFESLPEVKPVLEAFNKREVGECLGNINGPLDEEIFKFKHQIQMTSMLLDSFVLLRLLFRQKYSENTEIQTSSVNEQSSVLTQKFIKKFTLQSKDSSSTSVNSDSPITGVELQNHFAWMNNPIRRRVASEFFDDLPTGDAHDLQKLLIDDSDGVQDLSAIDKEVQRGLFAEKLVIEMVSPSFSDNTLKNLGLLNEGESPKLNQKEMEEKFTLLVANFVIDISTVKDRFQAQKTRQEEIKVLFSQELRKLVMILMNINKQAKDFRIKQFIEMSINQIHTIVSVLSQTSELAMQYGALWQEQRFLKITNFMINYAANLTKHMESMSHQLKSTSPQKSFCRNLHQDQRLNSSDSSCSLQSKEISSISVPHEDNSEPENNTVFQSKSLHFIPDNTCEPLLNTDQQNHELQIYSNPKNERKKKCVILFLFCLFVLITVISIIIMLDLNIVSINGYPWRWASWDDIFPPSIQKIYFRRPPPT